MPTGKYTDKLFKLLESTRVRRDEKTSHYSMGTPVCSFYISGSKRDRLNRLISRSIQEGTVLHILEAHRSQGPIIFDIEIVPLIFFFTFEPNGKFGSNNPLSLG